MNLLLDKAIEYAEMNAWFVFLTRDRKRIWNKDGKDIILKVKSPYVKGRFEVATRDEKQIREWWAKYPNAGIGVAAKRGNFEHTSIYKNLSKLETIIFKTLSSLTKARIRSGTFPHQSDALLRSYNFS